MSGIHEYVKTRKRALNDLLDSNQGHPCAAIWSGKLKEWEDLEASGVLGPDNGALSHEDELALARDNINTEYPANVLAAEVLRLNERAS